MSSDVLLLTRVDKPALLRQVFRLVALNTGLISALSGLPLTTTRERPDLWGRLVESAVGHT